MGKACCCYIVDAGYLFPTLLSAIQARAAVSPARADIVIFCVGPRSAETDLFGAVCQERNIRLTLVAPAAIDDMPIMFARFFLTRFLDPHYDAVIYLDGDTQIAGALDPLLDMPLESGRFLAARDPMSLLIDRPGREWQARRDYFRSIGLADHILPRYLNSGVLRFNRGDWAAISAAALRISREHRHSLKFPDQDALNLTFGADYRLMSFRWNFPAFFLTFGFQNLIKPTIYHFMSNPRPWNGPFRPWGSVWHEPYLRLVQDHPELLRYHPTAGRLKSLRYVAQQRFKALIEAPVWKTTFVQNRILQHESEACM